MEAKALPLLMKLVLQNVNATRQASDFPTQNCFKVTLLFSAPAGHGWKNLRMHFLCSDLLLRKEKKGLGLIFNSRGPESSPVIIS